ncbi:MAG: hypothetical protein QRY74_01805 [Chlamydia sp.]
MDQFLKELYQGDLDLHDVWQIELETAIPLSKLGPISSYIQEFYLLIPPSLQISSKTYSREHFYKDRTNFIREKTPDFPLKSLVERTFLEEHFFHPLAEKKEMHSILYLIANIFRSSLRKHIHSCFLEYSLNSTEGARSLSEKLSHAIACTEKFLQIWSEEIQQGCFEEENIRHCTIARRYISVTIENYFSNFLLHIDSKASSILPVHLIKSLLQQEKSYRKEHFSEPESLTDLSEKEQEELLHERDSDKKSIRSVLFFLLKRRSFSERWNNVIASCAAGLAAFVYLGIIFWKSSFIVMNSMTFVVLSSILYMLKDRIKEGVKGLFQRQAGRFFDDFRTDIFEESKKHLLGKIHEYFMFLQPRSIPKELRQYCAEKKRNTSLEELSGEVIYYRKKVVFHAINAQFTKRTRDLHTVFRLNLRSFFEKASNPYEEVAIFDPRSSMPSKISLPKVYYLYFFIKTIQCMKGKPSKSSYQKYLLSVDKSGIKRVVSLDE